MYPNLVLTNTGDVTCTVEGYPGVSLIDADGDQIGAAATREETDTPVAISLKPGDSAYSELQITNADMFDEETCNPTAATALRVYPPDQTDSLTVNASYMGCANEETPIITVRALVHGSGE